MDKSLDMFLHPLVVLLVADRVSPQSDLAMDHTSIVGLASCDVVVVRCLGIVGLRRVG